ncbi:MAG TPA: hypothetical protein VL173_07435 [Vicinamibacterales bacterium]|jgi:hypothetical protein|nr:hypothetical protein [Vicinamibacterales bacterium]
MLLQVVSIVSLIAAGGFAAIAWRLSRQEQRRSAARVAALAEAIDGETPAPVDVPGDGVAVHPEFLTPQRSAPATRILLKIALGFAAGVALIVAVTMVGAHHHEAVTATAADNASLELLSMRPEREGDTLTVTGLVRNAGSGAVQHLTAVVLTFDRNSNFIASGRAPLDFVTLGPGDESPFRVSVPNVGDVGRYRVSFRTEAGVVTHVDKRHQLLAKK